MQRCGMLAARCHHVCLPPCNLLRVSVPRVPFADLLSLQRGPIHLPQSLSLGSLSPGSVTIRQPIFRQRRRQAGGKAEDPTLAPSTDFPPASTTGRRKATLREPSTLTNPRARVTGVAFYHPIYHLILSYHPTFVSSYHLIILSSYHPVILSSYHPILSSYLIILSSYPVLSERSYLPIISSYHPISLSYHPTLSSTLSVYHPLLSYPIILSDHPILSQHAVIHSPPIPSYPIILASYPIQSGPVPGAGDAGNRLNAIVATQSYGVSGT